MVGGDRAEGAMVRPVVFSVKIYSTLTHGLLTYRSAVLTMVALSGVSILVSQRFADYVGKGYIFEHGNSLSLTT